MSHPHDNKLDRALMYMLYEAGKIERQILVICIFTGGAMFLGGAIWLLAVAVQAAL